MNIRRKTLVVFSLLIVASMVLAACAPEPVEIFTTVEVPGEQVIQTVEVTVPVEVTQIVEVTPAAPVLSQEDIDQLWKQYEGQGLAINFLSEDTPPTAAIVNHLQEFEDLTGITVNLTTTNLADVGTKVLLDFSAGTGDIHVIYADPFIMLAPLYGHFLDLNDFVNDPTLPPVPNGIEDFDEMNMVGSGYMIDKEKLLAIPYDAPTILLTYRTDIFENETFKQMFMDEKGYDWTPGPNITWEQYAEIAEWINGKVADGTLTEVSYGTGHQARQYDSLMCDFSDVLLAYGANYFANPDFATWGTSTPGGATLDTPEAIQAAEVYNSILAQADPGSLGWDWNGVAEAFAAGNLAMSPQWHEYASMFQDPTKSKVVDEVKWALLPSGPAGSKNLWGGTGLAINGYASEDLQRAAWLFILWATSPDVQKALLLEGATPTRTSVYEDPEVQQWIQEKKTPLMDTLVVLKEAWAPEHIGLSQGKIVTWIQVDETIFTNLSQMLTGGKTPEQAMQDATEQINTINNWPPPTP